MKAYVSSSQNYENLKEAVATDKPRRELKEKIKNLKAAMKEFTDFSDDEGKLLQAMPNGMKNVMAVQDTFSKAKEKLDGLENSLMNAQEWDSKKLEK